MERLSYEQLRITAIEAGVPDNRVSIGCWLKANGYLKKHTTDKRRKTIYYYIKL